MSLATSPDSWKEFMFVEIVEVGEMAKIFACPSDVRLEIAESFYSVIPQYRFYSFKFGFVIVGILPEMELNVSVFDFNSARNFGKRPHRMIEARSKVIDCIPDKKGEVSGDSRDFTEAIQAISCIRISLESDRVRARLVGHESVVNSLKIEDVRFGPFSF
jgi:hypothetical protein